MYESYNKRSHAVVDMTPLFIAGSYISTHSIYTNVRWRSSITTFRNGQRSHRGLAFVKNHIDLD